MTTQKIEFVVPEIVYPDFPSLSGAYAVTDTETAVPNSWLFSMAEFKILYDEAVQNYTKIKLLYEGEK